LRQYTPQTEKHLAAGDRNRLLAGYALSNGKNWIDPPPHEWVITLAFYAALHYVDAYLVEHGGGSPNDHAGRNFAVNTVAAFANIASAYGQLYGRSITARYDPMHPFSSGAVQSVLNDMRFVQAEIRKIL